MAHRYKVAVIQNHRELNQYSYADIIPTLAKLNLHYSMSSYYSENISQLFENDIYNFDAIIFSTNACNDNKILDAVISNKYKIEKFIDNGNGILILFQKKLDTLSFLIDDYNVTFENRTDEHLVDGKIVKDGLNPKHPILIYPNYIDIEKLAEQSNKNADLRGLYWKYIKTSPNCRFETLLLDDSYGEKRKLLITSGLETEHRLIITTLMFDWQKQEDILKNCVKFAVEGKPSVMFLKKEGSDDYYINYIIETLRSSKTPYLEISEANFDLNMIPPICDTVIVDPSWSIDKDNTIEKNILEKYLKTPNICFLYFEKIENSEKSVVKSIGGTKTYSIMLDKIDILLHTKLSDKTSFLDNSFLNTVTTIEILREIGGRNDYLSKLYHNHILSETILHDTDGSYDGVFGATCSLLKLYKFFNDNRYKKTESWLVGQYNQQDFPEKILFVNTLYDLQYDLHDHTFQHICTIDGIRDIIIEKINSSRQNTTLELERYLTFLCNVKFYEVAYEVVRKLLDIQDRQQGSWTNMAQTAKVLKALLRIQNTCKEKNISGLKEAIFSGIIFLKSYINEIFTTKNGKSKNIYTSEIVTSLYVLSKFEHETNYNMDEILLNLKKNSSVGNLATYEIRRIFDTSLSLYNNNNLLSSEVENLKKSHSDLIKENTILNSLKDTLPFAQKSIFILYTLMICIICSTSLYILWTLNNPQSIFEFFEKWQTTILTITGSSFTVYTILLNYFAKKLKFTSPLGFITSTFNNLQRRK